MESKAVQKGVALPTKVDADSYNSLVRAAKLATIQLVESNFKITPEYFTKLEPSGRKRGFHCDIDNISIESDRRAFWAHLIWHTYVKLGKKFLFRLDCDYLCAYSAEFDQHANFDHVTEQNVTLFLERVGKVATYPYFRATASQFSWAANADLPMLPVLKSFPIRSAKK